MKQLLFYAFKTDLLPILEEFESKLPIKYVKAGKVDEKVETFTCGADIPRLGIANSTSASTCDTYLVLKQEVEVKLREVRLEDGRTNVHVDQLLNPDSVTLSFGGLCQPNILLYGRMSTASDYPSSSEILKIFNGVIRKKFKKVKAYWVGDEAMCMLEEGKRLTISSQSPVDFDLKIQ